MTPAPAVSVIVPAFRAADFLRAGIPRLEQQSFDDFEVLIVDDGSGDDTAIAARELADRFPRVRALVLDTNVGVATARKHAVTEAQGEYLWFIDADDRWPSDALSILVTAARRHEADVVVAAAVFHYPDGSTRPLPAPRHPPADGKTAFRLLLTGQITGHLWNKLFRREVMAAASFAPALVQSDLIMVADGLSNAKHVAFVTTSVYEYHLRPGSIIMATKKRAESLAIIDEFVRADAVRLGVVGSAEYRMFRARYISMSSIKDALLAPYSPPQRRELVARARRQLTWSDIALFVRSGDVRRTTLAVTAKTSVPAHRFVLRIAER